MLEDEAASIAPSGTCTDEGGSIDEQDDVVLLPQDLSGVTAANPQPGAEVQVQARPLRVWDVTHDSSCQLLHDGGLPMACHQSTQGVLAFAERPVRHAHLLVAADIVRSFTLPR